MNQQSRSRAAGDELVSPRHYATVKWFDEAVGYGFMTDEATGADVFFHITALQLSRSHSIDPSDRVSFDLETDRRGKTQAVNIRAA